MARKNRGHRPPPQSRQLPPGQVPVIDPNAQERAKAEQEAVIRGKVESVAATIYTNQAVANPDLDEEENKELNLKIAERAIDAALVLGKELWGLQAQRVKPPVQPKRRPNVLTEEDDDGEE